VKWNGRIDALSKKGGRDVAEGMCQSIQDWQASNIPSNI